MQEPSNNKFFLDNSLEILSQAAVQRIETTPAASVQLLDVAPTTSKRKLNKRVSFRDEQYPYRGIADSVHVETDYRKRCKNLATLANELNHAAYFGKWLAVKDIHKKVGAETFKQLLELPSKLPEWIGYKTLHFIVEVGAPSLILYFFNNFQSDLLVTIDNKDLVVDGFTPLQLAVYKHDYPTIHRFKEIPVMEFEKILNYRCQRGKYRGYHALHIALEILHFEYLSDRETNRLKTAISYLLSCKVDLDSPIDQPGNPWHGKNARQLLQDSQLQPSSIPQSTL